MAPECPSCRVALCVLMNPTRALGLTVVVLWAWAGVLGQATDVLTILALPGEEGQGASEAMSTLFAST